MLIFEGGVPCFSLFDGCFFKVETGSNPKRLPNMAGQNIRGLKTVQR